MALDRRPYAGVLTKEYLEYLGITGVSIDGKHIYNKYGREYCQVCDGRYLLIEVYDPARRAQVPPEYRNSNTGQFTIGVHRVVYVWYSTEHVIPEGLVINHRDSDKQNNAFNNLEIVTPGKNIWMNRKCNIRLLKCDLKRPRSFYEEKLKHYEELYANAKANRDQKEAHKQRSNVSNVRAMLRYYDEMNK